MPLSRQRVAVIGAGIGGLAAALALAAQGLEVTVLERADAPGGKARRVEAGGQAIDAGPTVFTMRWVFDELLAPLGVSLDDALGLQPLRVLARHAWDEGPRLDLHADLDSAADAIATFAGPAEARRYLAFCRRAQRVYDALEAPFLRAPRPNPLSLVLRGGLRGLPGLLRISPFETLWQALGDCFEDARLRQLFGRYATYCGASPMAAPATLMLVAHVERAGVWTVDGGLHALARLLERLARAQGVVFRYRADVQRIVLAGGRAAGVELADGERLESDAVLFNGDPTALDAGLLGDAARRAAPGAARAQRSLSAITWAFTAEADAAGLYHHTVCFSRDYPREFAQLRDGRLPDDPTLYICAQDRRDDTPPARGTAERLLCLVNAPARGDEARPWTDEEIHACETASFERLARCGLSLRPTAPPLRTTPSDFHRLFPGTGGALYGRAPHGWLSSFQRPAQRSAIPGLVLAGGATHPGPGVPMAALSGRLAAQEILAQLRQTRRVSTPPSRPAATSGGTSTP